MPNVREWLPKEAFSEAVLKAVIAPPLARWSSCWVGKQKVSVRSVRLEDQNSPLSGSGPSLKVKGLAAEAEISGRGKRCLLEALLDIDLASQTLNPNDHKLLDVLAEQAVRDLMDIVDGTFSAGPTGGHFVYAIIGLGSSEIGWLRFCDGALVRALKSQHGAARSSKIAPRDRIAAVKTVQVAAKGILGTAELPLEDLQNLAVGDVVPLHQGLQDPVELRLSENGRRVARGRLCQHDGQISIQL